MELSLFFLSRFLPRRKFRYAILPESGAGGLSYLVFLPASVTGQHYSGSETECSALILLFRLP